MASEDTTRKRLLALTEKWAQGREDHEAIVDELLAWHQSAVGGSIEDFIRWYNSKTTNRTITFEQLNEYYELAQLQQQNNHSKGGVS